MKFVPITQNRLEEAIDHDIQMLREARKHAEEIVRDRGWSEKDDDFEIQIEEETKEVGRRFRQSLFSVHDFR